MAPSGEFFDYFHRNFVASDEIGFLYKAKDETVPQEIYFRTRAPFYEDIISTKYKVEKCSLPSLSARRKWQFRGNQQLFDAQ